MRITPLLLAVTTESTEKQAAALNEQRDALRSNLILPHESDAREFVRAVNVPQRQPLDNCFLSDEYSRRAYHSRSRATHTRSGPTSTNSNEVPEVDMRAGLIRSSIVLSRTVQVAGGIGTALLGLIICLHIVIKDASLPVPFKPSDYFVVFLMLAVPGISVAIGTYLQVIHGKSWGGAFVLIGGLCNLIFVGLNAGFLFAYSGDIWGERAVLADLAVVIFTIGAAFVNAIVPVIFRNRLE